MPLRTLTPPLLLGSGSCIAVSSGAPKVPTCVSRIPLRGLFGAAALRATMRGSGQAAGKPAGTFARGRIPDPAKAQPRAGGAGCSSRTGVEPGCVRVGGEPLTAEKNRGDPNPCSPSWLLGLLGAQEY